MSSVPSPSIPLSPQPPSAGALAPATAAGHDLPGVLRAGLWTQNPALVQLLGLCPLMAVSTTLVNGTSLGLATTVVMAGSGAAVSLLRGAIAPHIRIPAFILVIAVLVTLMDMTLHAALPGLYRVLGLFVPLIVTNCLLLARAEVFASRSGPWASAVDGIGMGLGLTGALAVLGALRELLGQGTLLAGIDLVAGPAAHGLTLHVAGGGFPLALLPPGAFLSLGGLIALRNLTAARQAAP